MAEKAFAIFYTVDNCPDLIMCVKREEKAREFCELMNQNNYKGMYCYTEIEII